MKVKMIVIDKLTQRIDIPLIIVISKWITKRKVYFLMLIFESIFEDTFQMIIFPHYKLTLSRYSFPRTVLTDSIHWSIRFIKFRLRIIGIVT